MLADKRLLASSKTVFALLRFRVGSAESEPVSLRWLGDNANITKDRTIRAVHQLERLGLISVERGGFREINRYTVRSAPTMGGFLLIADDILDAKMPPVATQLYALLRFKVGSNGKTWPRQTELAQSLGVSVPTIRNALKWLRIHRYIQQRSKGGGHHRPNVYRLTTRLDAEVKNHAERPKTWGKKCDPKDKTYKVKTFNRRISSRRSYLKDNRTPADKAFSLLKCNGVKPSVAQAIVYEQHHPPASIFQAVANGKAKAHFSNGLWRLRPGYIVAALNRARSESKAIGTTTLFRKVRFYAERQKNTYTPLSPDEFERRKAMLRDQLKRMTG